jgi:serine/threonine protein kinase
MRMSAYDPCAGSRSAGTVFPLSPKAFADRRSAPQRMDPYGFKSDVFSFGVVLCELVTGRYPYEDLIVPTSLVDFEKAIISGLRPRLPDDLLPGSTLPSCRCHRVAVCVRAHSRGHRNEGTYHLLLGRARWYVRQQGFAGRALNRAPSADLRPNCDQIMKKLFLIEEKQKVLPRRSALPCTLLLTSCAARRPITR